MDNALVFIAVVALSYLGAVIFMANQADAARALAAQQHEGQRESVSAPSTTAIPERDGGIPGGFSEAAILRDRTISWMLYGAVAVMLLFGLLVFLSAFAPEENGLSVGVGAATANFAITLAFAGLSISVLRSPTRRLWVKRMLPPDAAYDPRSVVHTTAIVLSLVLLSLTLGAFVSSGGLTGLAEDIGEGGISIDIVILQTVLEVAAAFLGIGLVIRRTWRGSLKRLALRLPTSDDVWWGVGVGFALFLAVVVISGIWALAVSPEQFEEQTAASEQIAASFDTLPRAFTLAISAAVGEEILFRGALQPIFGILPVALFFTLLHTQYTLTPATLIILVVALGLGWLRKRLSTSATIIAHFVFNFIQLALAIVANSPIEGV